MKKPRLLKLLCCLISRTASLADTGAGFKTGSLLASLGIETVAQLRAVPRTKLDRHFGQVASNRSMLGAMCSSASLV